jgi:hypothetical protein
MLLLAVYVAIGILSVYVSIVQCRSNPDAQNFAPETVGAVIFLAAVFWPFALGFHLTSGFFGLIGRAVQSQK